MVVLDADSALSGDCIVKLVRLMEASPSYSEKSRRQCQDVNSA